MSADAIASLALMLGAFGAGAVMIYRVKHPSPDDPTAAYKLLAGPCLLVGAIFLLDLVL